LFGLFKLQIEMPTNIKFIYCVAYNIYKINVQWLAKKSTNLMSTQFLMRIYRNKQKLHALSNN